MESRIIPIEPSSPLLAELFYAGHDISDQILNEILALPRNELINDLEQLIEYGINRFEFVRSISDETGNWSSFPLLALFLLTELKSEGSFPLLLKLCNSDKEVLDFYFGDYTTECMWQDAMLLGYNQVNASIQFFKDGAEKSFSGNCIVSDGLTQLYLHYPEKQQEVKAAFREILEFLWAKNPDDDDLELNEVILNAVADTKDVDLFPLCKSFYDELRTACYMTENWEEFEETVHDDYVYKRSILDIRSRLNYFERMERDSRLMESELEYLEPIVKTEPKIQRNDPCTCGSGLKYKKCCMNNELQLDL